MSRPHEVFLNGSMPNDSFPLLERAASPSVNFLDVMYQRMTRAVFFLIKEKCRKYRSKLFLHHSRK